MSSAREKLLRLVASEIETLLDSSIVRVGIDGVDGAGKTWFANELAERSRANVICNPRGHQREVGIATHHRITYFRFWPFALIECVNRAAALRTVADIMD